MFGGLNVIRLSSFINVLFSLAWLAWTIGDNSYELRPGPITGKLPDVFETLFTSISIKSVAILYYKSNYLLIYFKVKLN